MPIRTLEAGWGITVLRALMGIILIVAGYQKFAGGLGGFAGFLTNLGVPMPEIVAPLIATLELVGGALILLGLGVRWVAILVLLEFLFIVFAVKLPRQPPAGGWDSARVDMLIAAAAVMLILAGAGKLSLDAWLRSRNRAGRLTG